MWRNVRWPREGSFYCAREMAVCENFSLCTRIFSGAREFFSVREIFPCAKFFLKTFSCGRRRSDPGLCYLYSGPEIVIIYVLLCFASSHVPRWQDKDEQRRKHVLWCLVVWQPCGQSRDCVCCIYACISYDDLCYASLSLLYVSFLKIHEAYFDRVNLLTACWLSALWLCCLDLPN